MRRGLSGVRASVPIFDGFQDRIREARSCRGGPPSELSDAGAEKRIESEFRTAMFDMNSRYKQMELARKEIDLGHDEVSRQSFAIEKAWRIIVN